MRTPEEREADARRDFRRAVIYRVLWNGRRRLSGGPTGDDPLDAAYENLATEVEKALREVRL